MPKRQTMAKLSPPHLRTCASRRQRCAVRLVLGAGGDVDEPVGAPEGDERGVVRLAAAQPVERSSICVRILAMRCNLRNKISNQILILLYIRPIFYI